MVQAGEDGGFAHELVARFPQHFRSKRGIVPHLFNSAETTAQAGVFGQVDVSKSTLANHFFNPVASVKHGVKIGLKSHRCFQVCV